MQTSFWSGRGDGIKSYGKKKPRKVWQAGQRKWKQGTLAIPFLLWLNYWASKLNWLTLWVDKKYIVLVVLHKFFVTIPLSNLFALKKPERKAYHTNVGLKQQQRWIGMYFCGLRTEET